jgi:SAM-dependent methyltransferase
MRVTARAHELVRAVVRPGETVIDATVGNGRDTLFLAQCVGPRGRVIGFDVQPEALARARERLLAAGVGEDRLTLLACGHEVMGRHVDAPVGAVMFNLGYLPGGDHGLITRPETTVAALHWAAGSLRKGGVLSIVCYPGHPGGRDEVLAVNKCLESLPCNHFQVSWTTHELGKSTPRLLHVSKL